jgi:integrase
VTGMFYGFYYLLGTGFINEYMSGSFTGFADERHFAQTFFHHPFKVSSQKTKKTRKIKINPDLKTSVMRLKDLSGVVDSDWSIFMNRYGTKPIDKSWININLKKIFKQYGIECEGNISSHLFRKTLGNRVLKLNNYSNESVILLMELFGHSSVTITKKYLGIREREVMSVYDSLSL